MAVDWIKMRADLQKHPKVRKIASAICPQSVPDKFRAIGALHAVWSLFDALSVDGSLNYSPEDLDAEAGVPGIARAMESVDWLFIDRDRLSLPEFTEHNGQSAKRRAEDQKRKRNDRRVRIVSIDEPDELRTREEKRREESKEPTSLAREEAAGDQKRTRKRTATHITPEWQPSAEWISRLEAECPAVDAMRVLPEFRDYWIGEGKPKADWNATFANRIRTIAADLAAGNRRAVAAYGRHDRRATSTREPATTGSPRKIRTSKDFGAESAADFLARTKQDLPAVSNDPAGGADGDLR